MAPVLHRRARGHQRPARQHRGEGSAARQHRGEGSAARRHRGEGSEACACVVLSRVEICAWSQQGMKGTVVSLGNGSVDPPETDREGRRRRPGGVLGGGCCASWLLQAAAITINCLSTDISSIDRISSESAY
jgi:hypothetical protein